MYVQKSHYERQFNYHQPSIKPSLLKYIYIYLSFFKKTHSPLNLVRDSQTLLAKDPKWTFSKQQALTTICFYFPDLKARQSELLYVVEELVEDREICPFLLLMCAYKLCQDSEKVVCLTVTSRRFLM